MGFLGIVNLFSFATELVSLVRKVKFTNLKSWLQEKVSIKKKSSSSTLLYEEISKNNLGDAERVVLNEGTKFLNRGTSGVSLVIPISFEGRSLLVFINPHREMGPVFTLSVESLNYESRPFSDILGFEVEVKTLFEFL